MHQSLMPPQLFPQQPQHAQQSSQHNLGLLQNNQVANAGLGIIAGQPGPSNPNYPMNMQPGNPQRRAVFMSAQPNGSGLHPGGPPHMAGLAPNQMQGLQSMSGNMGGFPGVAAGMIPQQTIRRVQSQPLGQGGAHMGGMQPGMMGGGMAGMPGPPQMSGMRMAPSVQMRQPQQQHGQGGGGMSPEMGLPMGRPGPMPGASQLQPPHARSGSGSQLMPTLTQSANFGQGHAMQHNFGGPMPLSHQHQPSQMGSSTHVGPSGQQPPNMGPQPGGNRAQMVTPDNNMFMNFQNTPIQPPLSHGVPRMPLDNVSNPQFNIAPSPSPMNGGGDMSQRGNGPMNPSGPMTPAQVLNMNAGGDGFPANSYSMGQPPISAPPRPPSHNGPHNGFPMPPSQSQPSLAPQQSPRQPDHLSNPMHPRPQSQPQVAHRSSPIPPPGPVRTPRGSQPSLPVNVMPMNTSGMLPPARVPTATGQSPQGPSHPPAQPSTSAPAQIAPRPPSVTPAAPAGASAPARSTSTAPSASTAAESSQPPRASAPPSAPAPGPSAPAPAVQPGSAVGIPRK